jgi:hypothetical protein
MNDKLYRMWKEAVVAKFKEPSAVFPEGLRKTTKKIVMIAGLRAKTYFKVLLMSN